MYISSHSRTSSLPGPTLIVIGGGAAGFFCAVNAARLSPHLKVILLEKSGKLLSKVKVSGGGRCNVTHACFDREEMSRFYPRGQHFLKRAFHHFFTTDTIAWFEERGVPLKTEPDGRMFPESNRSESVIQCLIQEANRYQVDIRMNAHVTGLYKKDSEFSIQLADNRILLADYVCVACGGWSKPEQFSWLKTVGHGLVEPVPSLFTFNLPNHPITRLQGVSVPDATLKIAGTKLKETGPVLITHWGLSGPAVLRLSAWGARILFEREYNFSVSIQWLCDFTETHCRQWINANRQLTGKQELHQKNTLGLPQRLWEFLLEYADIPSGRRWAELTQNEQNNLINALTAMAVEVKGKTTFKEEFVTAGGIPLSEVNAQTLESKVIPGLYFAGEMLDVDGVTGGFNFQNAWTTGYIAAKSIAESYNATEG